MSDLAGLLVLARERAAEHGVHDDDAPDALCEACDNWYPCPDRQAWEQVVACLEAETTTRNTIREAAGRIGSLTEWPIADVVDAEATLSRIGIRAEAILALLGAERAAPNKQEDTRDA